MTPVLNQHIPVYCGSCWLHAGIATLNDRLKIAMNASWPEVMLARQVALNCGGKIAGNCSGGSDLGLYAWASIHGLPDDSCQPYVAKEQTCDWKGNCMNCDPNPSLFNGARRQARQDSKEACYPVQRYGRYFVTEYGRMKSPTVFEMQAEIYRRGPISCSVDAGALEFGQYTPGEVINASLSRGVLLMRGGAELHLDNGEIPDEKVGNGRNQDGQLETRGLARKNGIIGKEQNPRSSTQLKPKITWEPDHDVSVAGWGQDEGGMYWIVRNSWGSFWGDNGWFYVRAGYNSMGIEDLCHWAVIEAEPRVEDYGPSDGEKVFASTEEDPGLDWFRKLVIPHEFRRISRRLRGENGVIRRFQ